MKFLNISHCNAEAVGVGRVAVDVYNLMDKAFETFPLCLDRVSKIFTLQVYLSDTCCSLYIQNEVHLRVSLFITPAVISECFNIVVLSLLYFLKCEITSRALILYCDKPAKWVDASKCISV